MATDSVTLLRMEPAAGWNDRFAELDVASDLTTGNCSCCRRLFSRVPSPFEICRSYDRWNPNVGPIPDISHLGRFTVVSDAAKQALASISGTIDFEPVVVVENPKRRRGFGKRGASRFAEELARDQESQLWRLKVTTCYEMDLERSGRTVEQHCPACGFVRYAVAPNSSIVVDAAAWHGEDIFKLIGCGCKLRPDEEFFGPDFVTARARDILAPLNLSNLCLRDVGYIERARSS